MDYRSVVLNGTMRTSMSSENIWCDRCYRHNIQTYWEWNRGIVCESCKKDLFWTSKYGPTGSMMTQEMFRRLHVGPTGVALSRSGIDVTGPTGPTGTMMMQSMFRRDPIDLTYFNTTGDTGLRGPTGTTGPMLTLSVPHEISVGPTGTTRTTIHTIEIAYHAFKGYCENAKIGDYLVYEGVLMELVDKNKADILNNKFSWSKTETDHGVWVNVWHLYKFIILSRNDNRLYEVEPSQYTKLQFGEGDLIIDSKTGKMYKHIGDDKIEEVEK